MAKANSNRAASYTSESNITIKFEYHFNQAGLSKIQAGNWFLLGLKARYPTEIGHPSFPS
jgi:hypothetical protein